jgi:hypothetical protein
MARVAFESLSVCPSQILSNSLLLNACLMFQNLIPGAKPVPVNEVQLSQEEEDRQERESEEHDRDESDKRERSKNKDKDRDNHETLLDKRCVAPMSVSEAHKINVALTDDHRGNCS